MYLFDEIKNVYLSLKENKKMRLSFFFSHLVILKLFLFEFTCAFFFYLECVKASKLKYVLKSNKELLNFYVNKFVTNYGNFLSNELILFCFCMCQISMSHK